MNSWRGTVLTAEARKAGIASKDPSRPQAAVLDWHRCLQPLVLEFVILQTADFK